MNRSSGSTRFYGITPKQWIRMAEPVNESNDSGRKWQPLMVQFGNESNNDTDWLMAHIGDKDVSLERQTFGSHG